MKKKKFLKKENCVGDVLSDFAIASGDKLGSPKNLGWIFLDVVVIYNIKSEPNHRVSWQILHFFVLVSQNTWTKSEKK